MRQIRTSFEQPVVVKTLLFQFRSLTMHIKAIPISFYLTYISLTTMEELYTELAAHKLGGADSSRATLVSLYSLLTNLYND